MSTLLCALAMLLISAAGAAAERRVALVMGNSAYSNLPVLKNAAGDGKAMAEKLSGLGFEVVSGFDLSKSETQATMARFAKVVRGADMAVFFYAGHGLQVSGRNYLLPVDAVLEDETSLDFEAVLLDFVLRQMSRETKVRLVFLDACRDNPLAAAGVGRRFSDAGKGLAEVRFEDGGDGTLIAFATSPNEAAYDGSGEHSPFAAALLDHIGDENVQLTTVMTRVTGDVYKATAGKQRPWVNASLIDEVMLNPVAASEPLIVGTAPDAAAPDASGQALRSAQEPAASAEGDQVAMNALRAQIPKLGSDAPISFEGKVEFGDPVLDGKSIAELIQGKPRFPPIEGLDKTIWDKHCVSCHGWTKDTLCEQARTYDVDDLRIMRLPHPLGTHFKVALAKWAHGGCK
ncbi:caspase family protein [Arvimicrobium flavum]|uniref:caspase family protein n=1 Tax=Arvimicrobium flavum TaxID=3393320 RepID=UPI00398D1506